MINIVVPMAGRGSRFAGTNEWPKPLIEVIEGNRMIEVVVD
jgi:NDP-sugar pyrophosphorylase family protein